MTYFMQAALVKKDVKNIVSNKRLFLTLLIVPLILVVVLPSVFIISMHFVPDEAGEFNEMLKLLPNTEPVGNLPEMMIKIVINYVMPFFFMIIPVMAATVMAASSFVGEKEKHTLETLLYCPLTLRQIFKAKVLASFIMSMMITLISFVVMIVVAEVESYLTVGVFILPGISWLTTLLLIAPAISLIAIIVIVHGSAKAKTMEESQQQSIFLILPLILLIAGQFTGIILISSIILFVFGIILLAIGLLMLNGAMRHILYETMLK